MVRSRSRLVRRGGVLNPPPSPTSSCPKASRLSKQTRTSNLTRAAELVESSRGQRHRVAWNKLHSAAAPWALGRLRCTVAVPREERARAVEEPRGRQGATQGRISGRPRAAPGSTPPPGPLARRAPVCLARGLPTNSSFQGNRGTWARAATSGQLRDGSAREWSAFLPRLRGSCSVSNLLPSPTSSCPKASRLS